MSYRYYIGIDTGVNTGIAIYDRVEKKFIIVGSDMIHVIFDFIKQIFSEGMQIHDTLFVIEDARQVKFNTDKSKAQGAGSVKRDAKIWEDFLVNNGLNYLMVRPRKSITKLCAIHFNKLTGWSERTNEHARDAGMLVWGASYTPQHVLLEMEKLKGKKANIKITRNNLLS
jgi:hypothetical protein